MVDEYDGQKPPLCAGRACGEIGGPISRNLSWPNLRQNDKLVVRSVRACRIARLDDGSAGNHRMIDKLDIIAVIM